ncbi:MAG: hypothetical protein ACAI43_19370 [Phycisphaerae bacterium]|nr:hypothetical protein [Tepidisphaeraceae bacterium]
MKLDRSKAPPAYPKPVSNPLQRMAAREGNELQRRITTRANFNLYSPLGHVYLFGALALLAYVVALVVYHLVTEPIPANWARWDNLLLAASGVIGLSVFPTVLMMMYFKHRRITWMSQGRCPKCGYDCRASVDAGRCPECGRAFGG